MANQTYQEFVESKLIINNSVGLSVGEIDINPMLFDFQRDIVEWTLARGKAAIFTATGTGKTLMQVEWARNVQRHTEGNVLILAPLAVAQQTVREAAKLGVTITHCRKASDVKPGINITNYEQLAKFESMQWAGLVLDESSILKSFSGVIRKQITDFALGIDYRLACTATPAPNDLIEIINHAEFLGVMSGKEIIALFFKQDGNTTHAWRLKRHAVKDFYRWLASWAVALRRPSDLGYSDDGFIRPPVNWQNIRVELEHAPSDRLFHVEASTMGERLTARRESTAERVNATAALVNESNPEDSWVIWCNLNVESQALTKAIDGAVEITGSESPEAKEKKLIDFSNGVIKRLVTKPSIAGYGLNWQLCHNTVYVGLSDSFEDLHQSISRFDRYGQTKQVNAYVITAETEGNVVSNIARKRRQFEDMMDGLVKEMSGLQLDRCIRNEMTYREDVAIGEGWTLYLGDSVDMIDRVPDESIGLSVFSPPFPGMYVYSNSARDMGNVQDIDTMINQFSYLMAPDKVMRTLKPGRSCCIHLTQAVAFKGTDGYIGIKDFRGRVIEMMEAHGWVYYGEVCIDKDPQVKAIRTKDAGLLFKSLASDSSRMHMALADYLLQFRKPGDNQEPIRAGISEKYSNGEGWITSEEWIEWAAPVWYRQTKDYPGGIRETDVLNVAVAREADDERHLCPLQLGVIERAVKLWSNPGDTILSPFAGIGSEGYQSILLDRKFIGIELKESYWNTAIKNLNTAVSSKRQSTLFDCEVA